MLRWRFGIAAVVLSTLLLQDFSAVSSPVTPLPPTPSVITGYALSPALLTAHAAHALVAMPILFALLHEWLAGSHQTGLTYAVAGFGVALSRLLWRLPNDANEEERRAFDRAFGNMPGLFGNNVPVFRLPPTDGDGTSDLYYASDPQKHRLILFSLAHNSADTWTTVHSLRIVDKMEHGRYYSLDAEVEVYNAEKPEHPSFGTRRLGDLFPGHEGLHLHYAQGTALELVLRGAPLPISEAAYQAALNAIFRNSLHRGGPLENPGEARVARAAQWLFSNDTPLKMRLAFIAGLLHKVHQTPGLDPAGAFFAEHLMYYAYRHAPSILRDVLPGHIALMASPLSGGMLIFAVRYVDRRLARRGRITPFSDKLDVRTVEERLGIHPWPIKDVLTMQPVTDLKIPFEHISVLFARPNVPHAHPLALEAA